MTTRLTAALLRRVISCGVGCALLAQAAYAQQPADQPVFRTSTTAAVLDVIVRDGSGQPVPGLTVDDFEVFEDGVPQRIITFEAHGFEAAHVSSDAPRDVEPHPGAPSTKVSGAPTQSLVALVFHQLSHQPRSTAIKAAHAMIDELAPDDFAGVFAVELNLVPFAPFTRDRRVLHAALDEVMKRPPPSLGPLTSIGVAETDGPFSGPQTAQDAQFRQMGTRLMLGLEAPQHAAAQSNSLTGLVSMLSEFTGRKSVILISEGLIVSPRMDAVLDSAQAENVSFYTMNASGLSSWGRRSLPMREPDRSELTGTSVIRRSSWQKSFPEMDPTLGLGPLAERTGGFLVSDTNDLTPGLREINRDRRAFYVLSYSSRRATGEEEARSLEVRVRRPKVSVKARSGVIAAVPETP